MTDALASVIQRARRLLIITNNDFSWSGWDNATEATDDLDQRYADLLDHKPDAALKLSVLFAVTGPICETAVSSGWGDEYVSLGNDFDQVLNDWLRTHP